MKILYQFDEQLFGSAWNLDVDTSAVEFALKLRSDILACFPAAHVTVEYVELISATRVVVEADPRNDNIESMVRGQVGRLASALFTDVDRWQVPVQLPKPTGDHLADMFQSEDHFTAYATIDAGMWMLHEIANANGANWDWDTGNGTEFDSARKTRPASLTL